ncbi:MAG: hypothetical protein K2X86_12375 [Cytophagaceae bacterium]|nr:hypothetical protein [Cytophagaceae bacterium]
MSRKFLSILVLIATMYTGAQAQVVYFNGLGRAIVSNESLKGNVLNADPSAGLLKDTTSAKKGTGGYFLFDFGLNAQPSETVRAHALLRIKNKFGGFYGDSDEPLIQFRQIRLDGIIAKSIKYELGDIDLSLTPYTLYNFDEIYHDYEADVFANRRSVVHYENFNFGNKWRLQGVNVSTTAKFNKGIEKLNIRGFATRTRGNFLSIPDRFLMGGRGEVVQSKYFTLGANYTTVFDIPGTVASNLVNFKNNVVTSDYKINYDTDNIGIYLFGETGFSTYNYDSSSKAVSKDEYFYDLSAAGKYKPLDLKLFVSYRDVGLDFSSPGAQTRRIFDQGANTTIFKEFQNFGQRQPILFDRYSDELIRNRIITNKLMTFLPQYNNITPYGIATPNRKGITTGITAGGNEKFIKADAILDMLSEVSGEGTEEKRKFMGIKGGALVNLHKKLSFEKTLAINIGFRSENTTRSGPNKVDFSSILIDAGLTAEIFKGFELLAGYKMLSASGTEFRSTRDNFNQIVGLPTVYNVDLNEGIVAGGIRYRFGKNSYFTGQGHFVTYSDNKIKNQSYNINQFFLNYTLVF